MPDQPKKHNQIFICYRREDTAGVVGRIYDRLVQRFGKDTIFKDVDSLPLGRDFRRHIDSVVSECCVALVVVGDRWIGASGASRLDDPRDYVRIEIETALKRDIPVIPILVQNAELPPDESLPDSLKDFAYRNGMSIGHDPHFHSDVDRLIKHLEELIEDRRKETEVELAATSAIPAPEQVAPDDRPGSTDTYQQPIQVSPEQERPPVAPMASGSPETAPAASKPVESQTDFWIAPKDRRRIVLLYLALWLGVGLFSELLYTVLVVTHGVHEWTISVFVSLMTRLLVASGQVMILKDYIGSDQTGRRGFFYTVAGARRWFGYTVAASVVSNLARPLAIPPFFVPLLFDVPRAAFQCLVLRTKVKRAWLWIVANLVAGLLYSLVVLPRYGSDLSVAESLLMMSLNVTLTAAAEILCLITFRKKA